MTWGVQENSDGSVTLTARVHEELEAASEVAHTVLLMMGLGLLDEVPLENRKMLADPMTKWMAIRDGVEITEVELPA